MMSFPDIISKVDVEIKAYPVKACSRSTARVMLKIICNMILCAVVLLFSAVLINGAGRDHTLQHPWESSHSEKGRNLIYDQIEGWDPETIAVATQENLPRGVVSDSPSGRFRRAADMPPGVPEIPQPPMGMPEMPPLPPGVPSPPSMPGMGMPS